MVGDENTIATHLNGFESVFSSEYTLDPDLHIGNRPQPRHVTGPAVRIVIESQEGSVVRRRPDLLARKLQVGELKASRSSEIVTPFVESHTQDGRVCGEEDGFAALLLCLTDDTELEVAVSHGVKLHCVVDGTNGQALFADVLNFVVGEGADAHVYTGLGARSRSCQLTIWMSHCLQASWRDSERKPGLVAEDLGGGVTVLHIDKDSRPHTVFRVGSRIFANCDLLSRARVVEICA